jgi:hypothetical protein
LRFNLLKQELSDEKNSTFILEKIETFELDKVKDINTLDRALLMSQELDPSTI